MPPAHHFLGCRGIVSVYCHQVRDICFLLGTDMLVLSTWVCKELAKRASQKIPCRFCLRRGMIMAGSGNGRGIAHAMLLLLTEVTDNVSASINRGLRMFIYAAPATPLAQSSISPSSLRGSPSIFNDS